MSLHEYAFRLDRISTANSVFDTVRDFVSMTVSTSDTGEATISLECPASALFSPPALMALTPEVALGLSLRVDGVDIHNGEVEQCRFFLEDTEFDPTFPLDDPQDFVGGATPVTYSGRNIVHKLDFVSPWWNDLTDNRSFTPPATLDDVVNAWMGDFLTNWTPTIANPTIVRWHSGTTTLGALDQFGFTYPEIGAVYRNGTTLGDLFRDWRAAGLIYLRTQGRIISPLTVDPGFDRAVDPDIGNNVILRRAYDLLPGSRWRESDREQFNAIAMKFGTFGARTWASNNFVIAADNEVRENYLPASNVTATAEALSRILALSNEAFIPQREITLKLALGPSSPVPLYHYKAGDWIWVDYGAPLGTIRHKIRQMTLTIGEGGQPTEGEIVCETAPTPTVAENRHQLRRIIRGFDSTIL